MLVGRKGGGSVANDNVNVGWEFFHFLVGGRVRKKRRGQGEGEGERTLTIDKKHSSTKRKVELVIPLGEGD